MSKKTFYFRKIIHVFTGALYIYFFYFGIREYGLKATLFTATIALLLILLFEFFRIDFGLFQFVSTLTKSREKENFTAITYSLIVGIIVFAIFDTQIAFAAMSISIFGDASAAIFGSLLGKHKIHIGKGASGKGSVSGKTLEGFLAYNIAGLIVATAFFPLFQSLILVVIASIIELRCENMEDNLLIPMVVSFVAYIMKLFI